MKAAPRPLAELGEVRPSDHPAEDVGLRPGIHDYHQSPSPDPSGLHDGAWSRDPVLRPAGNWLDGEWLEVVRSDHDPASDGGHDITEDGLHMDVFRDGQKYRVEADFPPVELNRAPRYCSAYVREHADRLIRRFERWHNVSGPGH